MKKFLLENKKIKLCNKLHFVENKTELMYHVSNRVIFPCYLSMRNEFLEAFSYVRSHM